MLGRCRMSRGRPSRQPSRRNLELYHELVWEGRLQAEVAARFGLSQARVAQLRAQVAQWVAAWLPDELADSIQPAVASKLGAAHAEGLRLHLAIALRRRQLAEAYGPYLQLFATAAGIESPGHMLAMVDAGTLRARLPADLTGHVASAVRMARELEDLACVAERGPLTDLPEVLLLAEEVGEQALQAVLAT